MNAMTIARTTRHIPFKGTQLTVEELDIALYFARKPVTLNEVDGDEPPCRVFITETRELTPTEFDRFATDLLASCDWLRGKGGYVGEARLCVEVHAPGRPRLLIDPSGSDYARYVARLG